MRVSKLLKEFTFWSELSCPNSQSDMSKQHCLKTPCPVCVCVCSQSDQPRPSHLLSGRTLLQSPLGETPHQLQLLPLPVNRPAQIHDHLQKAKAKQDMTDWKTETYSLLKIVSQSHMCLCFE